MNKEKMLSIINLFISGITAYFLTLFYDKIGLANIYTQNKAVAVPHIQIIMTIWLIGAIFVILQFIKESTKFFVTSLVITWAAIPIGFMLAIWVAMLK